MDKSRQILILVDDNDNFIGYAPRTECHSGEGRRHRAFVIALYNRRGELLLQERRHWLWDKFWDLTAASHPLHIGNKDETYISSSERNLKDEWGITGVKLRKVGAFNYFEQHGKDCENEHCALILGEFNGKPNPDEAYGYRWLGLAALKKEVLENPKRFTPWLIEALPLLIKEKCLSGSSRF